VATEAPKATDEPTDEPAPEAAGIPGLTFGYVKGLADSEGFECEASTAAGFGWFCTKETGTASLVLQAIGPNASTVAAVGAEATAASGTIGRDEGAFLAYVATIEYDGNAAREAGQWVVDSIAGGADVTEADFGPAHYTLRAPAGMGIAMLDIEAP